MIDFNLDSKQQKIVIKNKKTIIQDNINIKDEYSGLSFDKNFKDKNQLNDSAQQVSNMVANHHNASTFLIHPQDNELNNNTDIDEKIARKQLENQNRALNYEIKGSKFQTHDDINYPKPSFYKYNYESNNTNFGINNTNEAINGQKTLNRIYVIKKEVKVNNIKIENEQRNSKSCYNYKKENLYFSGDVRYSYAYNKLLIKIEKIEYKKNIMTDIPYKIIEKNTNADKNLKPSGDIKVYFIATKDHYLSDGKYKFDLASFVLKPLMPNKAYYNIKKTFKISKHPEEGHYIFSLLLCEWNGDNYIIRHIREFPGFTYVEKISILKIKGRFSAKIIQTKDELDLHIKRIVFNSNYQQNSNKILIRLFASNFSLKNQQATNKDFKLSANKNWFKTYFLGSSTLPAINNADSLKNIKLNFKNISEEIRHEYSNNCSDYHISLELSHQQICDDSSVDTQWCIDGYYTLNKKHYIFATKNLSMHNISTGFDLNGKLSNRKYSNFSNISLPSNHTDYSENSKYSVLSQHSQFSSYSIAAFRNAEESLLWHKGQIFYEIDESFSKEDKHKIIDAIRVYDSTILKFKQKQSWTQNYIFFKNSQSPKEEANNNWLENEMKTEKDINKNLDCKDIFNSQCHFGMQGGKQIISLLSIGLDTGNIIHRLMHIIGFSCSNIQKNKINSDIYCNHYFIKLNDKDFDVSIIKNFSHIETDKNLALFNNNTYEQESVISCPLCIHLNSNKNSNTNILSEFDIKAIRYLYTKPDCTAKFFGNQKIKQMLHSCLTCKDNSRICAYCTIKCHKDHNIIRYSKNLSSSENASAEDCCCISLKHKHNHKKKNSSISILKKNSVKKR